MANEKQDVHKTGALAVVLGEANALEKLRQQRQANRHPTAEPPASTTPSTNSPPRMIDTHLCIPWKYADRQGFEFGDLDALADSIKESGQLQPALVRPLVRTSEQSELQYEIIHGVRRWKAAQMAGKQLLAYVESLNDAEAAVRQHAENAQRQDVSPYSLALFYKRLLDDKIFKRAELYRLSGMPKSTFSEFMAYTRIPEKFWAGVNDPNRISVSMAAKIASLASKGQAYVAALVELAGAITVRNLEERVRTLVDGERQTSSEQTHVVTDDSGEVLFQWQHSSRGKLMIALPKNVQEQVDITELEDILRSFIERQVN